MATHKIYRNGRLYDELDPVDYAIRQIVASYARDMPGDWYAVDENGNEYYRISASPVVPLPAALPKLKGEELLKRQAKDFYDLLTERHKDYAKTADEQKADREKRYSESELLEAVSNEIIHLRQMFKIKVAVGTTILRDDE